MRGLKRAKRDRCIMGICGGIARRYGGRSYPFLRQCSDLRDPILLGEWWIISVV